jgi:hypothetical protein
VAVIATAIISQWNAVHSHRGTRISNFINTVTTQRIEWMEKVRDDVVAASEAQANKPSHGGWIAESCGADINPATGEPRGARTGCCCIRKLRLTGDDRFDCKPSLTHFDCKAECAFFKDGGLPSSCTWTEGVCHQ